MYLPKHYNFDQYGVIFKDTDTERT